MLNWITALATAVIAVATVAYVLVSRRLWRSTQEMARLTKDSVDLNRTIYEGTHRPFLSTAIEMEWYQKTDNWLVLCCSVTNNGSDAAKKLEVELKSGIDQYHAILRFGDLQPRESRSVTNRFEVSGALARAWVEELRQSQPMKFRYSRTFRSGAGSDQVESGDIYYSPPELIRIRLEGRANRV